MVGKSWYGSRLWLIYIHKNGTIETNPVNWKIRIIEAWMIEFQPGNSIFYVGEKKTEIIMRLFTALSSDHFLSCVHLVDPVMERKSKVIIKWNKPYFGLQVTFFPLFCEGFRLRTILPFGTSPSREKSMTYATDFAEKQGLQVVCKRVVLD